MPLATNEVEAVSRRARDRWFHQDSNTVAAAVSSPRPPSSSRSSSPTNETVYAGGTSRANESSPIPPGRVVNITTRDALDHGVRCNNCNEWIMGRRYQCANCPSEPEAYNLVRGCPLCRCRIVRPAHTHTSARYASFALTASTTPGTSSSSLTGQCTSRAYPRAPSSLSCTARARAKSPLAQ